MRGITPVIAVILLMLITISMVGFAFVWFTRLAESATSTVGNETESLAQNLAKKISIDNVEGTSLALRNRGTATVQPEEIGFFIDGASVTCAGLSAISPGAIGTCTLSSACNAGSTMRITTPAGADEVRC